MKGKGEHSIEDGGLPMGIQFLGSGKKERMGVGRERLGE